MEITVKNKNIRISPRKMRPILYGLRGQNAASAMVSLRFVNKKGASFAHDLVKSAIAAAKENYLEADKIIITSIACNEGPRMKRMIPWSKGQSRRITKRMAHLVLTVASIEESKKSEEPVSSKSPKLEKNKTEEVK